MSNETISTLQARLDEAAKSSRNGVFILGLGLLLTLIAAGLGVYNTVVLKAELEQAQQALFHCHQSQNACLSPAKAAAAADLAASPAAEAVTESDAASVDESTTPVLAPAPALAPVTNAAGVSCSREVMPIQFAICMDARLARHSRAFWTVWNRVAPTMTAERRGALEAEQSAWLLQITEQCSLARRGPADPDQVTKALPCLRAAYEQRGAWIQSKAI